MNILLYTRRYRCHYLFFFCFEITTNKYEFIIKYYSEISFFNIELQILFNTKLYFD